MTTNRQMAGPNCSGQMCNQAEIGGTGLTGHESTARPTGLTGLRQALHGFVIGRASPIGHGNQRSYGGLAGSFKPMSAKVRPRRDVNITRWGAILIFPIAQSWQEFDGNQTKIFTVINPLFTDANIFVNLELNPRAKSQELRSIVKGLKLFGGGSP